jgi:serine/threonine-protein kinase
VGDLSANREPYGPGQEVPGTRCTVEYLLGEGGYGSVFRCRHVVLKRKVVLKLLLASHRGRSDIVERMMAEAQALAQLDHPNIALIHDAGMTAEDAPRPFLTLQYYPGETLAQALHAMPHGRGIGLLPALDLGIELCDALRAAHDRGIVHRDVKPGNIYLARTADGRTVTKVIDFGIAHFKEASTRATGRIYLGTPRYSAPEQIQGLPPSARTDLYAVGLVLYDCLCGRGPFDPEGGHLASGDLMRAHLQDEPAPLSVFWRDVPRDLEAVVAALVAKKPEERPPSASLVALRLREIKHRIVAESAPGYANIDGNRTEPTPFDNRQIRYSADTVRDAGPTSAASTAAAAALPFATTLRMDALPPVGPVGPAGTMRIPVMPYEAAVVSRTTATSEPVDRRAVTPSMEPPAPVRPTDGTEQHAEGARPETDNVYVDPETESGTYAETLASPLPAAGMHPMPMPGTLSREAVLSVEAIPGRQPGARWPLVVGAGGSLAVLAIAAAIGATRHRPARDAGAPAAVPIAVAPTTAVTAATRATGQDSAPSETASATPPPAGPAGPGEARPTPSSEPVAPLASTTTPASAAPVAAAAARPPRSGSPAPAQRARPVDKSKLLDMPELKSTFWGPSERPKAAF